MLQIRKAHENDIEDINNLYSQLNISKEEIEGKYPDLTICKDRNNLLACACGVINEESVYINLIIVKKEYLNQKIGSSLVKAILNNADLCGVKRAYMKCGYDAFAKYLRFNLLEHNEINKIEFDIFTKIYGTDLKDLIYTTALEGYFKPCSCR